MTDVTTITDACWRAVLDPEGCANEDASAAFDAGLIRCVDPGDTILTPTGEAALAKLREIAEGLPPLLTPCRVAGDHDPGIAPWLPTGVDCGRCGDTLPANYPTPGFLNTPLGRAALALLEGRGDG